MKYIIIVFGILCWFVFLEVSKQTQECRENNGEYIQTNAGGVCLDKKSVIHK